MMSFEIGAQMYTVREHTQTAEGLHDALCRVRDMGYRNVQLSGQSAGIEAEAIRDMLTETGLCAITTHYSFDEMQKNFADVVKKHRMWGVTYPGVGGMPDAYRGSAEGYARFAKEASAIARAFKEEGMTFIYHNHNFEFTRFDGKLGMDILLEESDPAFQFEIDTHWVQAGGADPALWIDRVRGRMDVVHFKDMQILPAVEGAGVRQAFAEVGSGNLHWDAIFAACEDTGVRYAFVEQDDFWVEGDPFLALQTSLRFLQGRGYK